MESVVTLETPIEHWLALLASTQGIPNEQVEEVINVFKKNWITKISHVIKLSEELTNEVLKSLPILLQQEIADLKRQLTAKPKSSGEKKKKVSTGAVVESSDLERLQAKLNAFAASLQIPHSAGSFLAINDKRVKCVLCDLELEMNKIGNIHNLSRHVEASHHYKNWVLASSGLSKSTPPKKPRTKRKHQEKTPEEIEIDIKRRQLDKETGKFHCYCLFEAREIIGASDSPYANVPILVCHNIMARGSCKYWRPKEEVERELIESYESSTNVQSTMQEHIQEQIQEQMQEEIEDVASSTTTTATTEPLPTTTPAAVDDNSALEPLLKKQAVEKAQ